MDKYEYRIRAEEINALIEQKDYIQAVKIADTIDWRRVRSVVMLCKVSELYKINRRYEESKEVLLLAYDLQPGSRKIVYSLCELSIKLEETVQAVEYYKEFIQIAPRDTGRFILQYRLYEAQDVSLEERIAVLEEYKKRDYREKWAYELAYLYHRIGLATRCVEECDELVLWFGEGKYVIKALGAGGRGRARRLHGGRDGGGARRKGGEKAANKKAERMAAVDADGGLRGDRRTRGGGNDPANGDEAGSKRRCTCRACRTGGSGDVFDGGAAQRSAARYGRRGGISRAAL